MNIIVWPFYTLVCTWFFASCRTCYVTKWLFFTMNNTLQMLDKLQSQNTLSKPWIMKKSKHKSLYYPEPRGMNTCLLSSWQIVLTFPPFQIYQLKCPLLSVTQHLQGYLTTCCKVNLYTLMWRTFRWLVIRWDDCAHMMAF